MSTEADEIENLDSVFEKSSVSKRQSVSTVTFFTLLFQSLLMCMFKDRNHIATPSFLFRKVTINYLTSVNQMSEESQLEREDRQKPLFKIGDPNDDQEVFFVVDEIGSNHGSEEDEPEVLFVKETSCANETTPGYNSSTKEAVNKPQSGDEEPEIIFSSQVSVELGGKSLSPESVKIVSDDEDPTTPKDSPVNKNMVHVKFLILILNFLFIGKS